VLLHNSKPPITNRLYIGLAAQKVASLFIQRSNNINNRFKVISTGMVDIMPMTNEIRRSMDLEKLEKRKEEIIGYQKDIETKLNQILATNKKLQEDFSKLMDQVKINNGALSEINNFIDAIKKNEVIADDTQAVEIVEEDKPKSKKKK